MVNIN